MVRIDWGDLALSNEERAELSSRFQGLDVLDNAAISIRKHRSGVEAELRLGRAPSGARVRLHGSTIETAVDRLVCLAGIVALETGRRRGVQQASDTMQRAT